MIAVRRTVDRFGSAAGSLVRDGQQKTAAQRIASCVPWDSGFADWPVVGPMDIKRLTSDPALLQGSCQSPKLQSLSSEQGLVCSLAFARMGGSGMFCLSSAQNADFLCDRCKISARLSWEWRARACHASLRHSRQHRRDRTADLQMRRRRRSVQAGRGPHQSLRHRYQT